MRHAAAASYGPDVRSAEAFAESMADDLSDYAFRKTAEIDLAESILMHAHRATRLYDIAQRMKVCHHTAPYGLYKPDGRWIVAWEEKCGDAHLCPHEARGNQKRLIRRYVPWIIEWLKAKPSLRRAFYAVFTTPNVALGALRDGKRDALRLFAEWYRSTAPAAPDDPRLEPGSRRRSLPKWRALVPDRRDDDGAHIVARGRPALGFHGALVHQEDPLSARGDWNVHMNVLLLVEGPLDIGEIRRTWGYDVHFPKRRGGVRGFRWDNDDELAAREIATQLTELVKYSAKMTAPSDTRAGDTLPRGARRPRRAISGGGGTPVLLDAGAEPRAPAPPMVAWPHACLDEWWSAQKRMRRTRTYGWLFRVPKPAPIDMDLVEWMGLIEWEGVRYSVDLVPEDKFSSSRAEKRHRWRGDPHEPQPPPPKPPRRSDR